MSMFSLYYVMSPAPRYSAGDVDPSADLGTLLWYGPYTAAQFRLQGPGSNPTWAEAHVRKVAAQITTWRRRRMGTNKLSQMFDVQADVPPESDHMALDGSA